MKKLFVGSLVSVGLAAAAPMLLAQTAAAEASTTPMQHVEAHRHYLQRPFSRPTERIDARLAYLRTALKITSAQKPQWDAFADVMRKQAGEREKRLQAWHAKAERRPRQHLTAIDRLERRQAILAVVSQNLQEIIAAAKPLYAVLSPEQRQIADQLFPHRGRRGGFHHHTWRRG